MKAHAIEPRWLTLKDASAYSGVTTRTLNTYITDGHVRSTNVIRGSNTRGRRLVDRLSLDAFLEAGVSRPPAKIVMNTIGKRHNGGRKGKGGAK